jgi:hypothetical protein
MMIAGSGAVTYSIRRNQSRTASRKRSTSSSARGLQCAIGPRSVFRLPITFSTAFTLVKSAPNTSQFCLMISPSSPNCEVDRLGRTRSRAAVDLALLPLPDFLLAPCANGRAIGGRNSNGSGSSRFSRHVSAQGRGTPPTANTPSGASCETRARSRPRRGPRSREHLRHPAWRCQVSSPSFSSSSLIFAAIVRLIDAVRLVRDDARDGRGPLDFWHLASSGVVGRGRTAGGALALRRPAEEQEVGSQEPEWERLGPCGGAQPLLLLVAPAGTSPAAAYRDRRSSSEGDNNCQ